MELRNCSWCDRPIAPDEGYRASEPVGERCAAFCRLEHVVPWVMRGAHWEAGTPDSGSPPAPGERCALCGGPLGDTRVLIVHHRGEHRVLDGLCGTEHLLLWARAGGRWRPR